MGNVDPINEIHMGTPQSIQQAVRICFKKAWDSPKGFTISLGCDTPCDAPLENAQAFIQEARRCAQYPLDPKNFS